MFTLWDARIPTAGSEPLARSWLEVERLNAGAQEWVTPVIPLSVIEVHVTRTELNGTFEHEAKLPVAA